MRAGIILGSALLFAMGTMTAAGTASAGKAPQRDKSQRPSPPAHAECKEAGGMSITVDYSSPRMKGRKIFGGLVPYGKVWRAGANEATTFVTSTEVRVGSLEVPAGSYTLFAIPEEGKAWMLVVSKKTGEWGIPYPGEQFDLGRTEMHVKALASPVEDFTIGFTREKDACELHMDWETTSASVRIAEKK